eukprot:scaffold511825_cov19-Prasinocladus_malaysianus.AAC.1
MAIRSKEPSGMLAVGQRGETAARAGGGGRPKERRRAVVFGVGCRGVRGGCINDGVSDPARARS